MYGHHHHSGDHHHHSCSSAHRTRTPLLLNATSGANVVVVPTSTHKNAHVITADQLLSMVIRIDDPKSGRAGRIAVETDHTVEVTFTTTSSTMTLVSPAVVTVNAPGHFFEYYGSSTSIYVQ